MAVKKGKRKRTTVTKPRDIEERLREAEELLAKRLSPAAVQQQLALKWKVTPRQVRDYLREVRRRWRDDATSLSESEAGRREAQRDHIRQTLNLACAEAMTKQMPLRGDKGETITDRDGNPILLDVPDIRSALRAAELLMDLDALALDKKIEITHTGTVSTNTFHERTREELEHFLKHGHFPAKPKAAPAAS